MSAITISRQMNSRGDELAARIAQQLGWRQVCRELINRSARTAGAPQVALAELDELDFFKVRPTPKQWRAYQDQVEHFIRQLAAEGDVIIVGRGGQIVLRDWLDVLHVRVVAPLETRIGWLQQEQHLSADAARERLIQSARSRAHYLKRTYNVDLEDPTLYHLVINTGLLDLSQAVNLVVEAFRSLSPQPEENQRPLSP